MRKRTIDAKRQKAAIFRRDGDRCRWCGERLTWEAATLDHLIPWSLGGTNEQRNLVLACAPCNNERGDAVAELEVKPRRERRQRPRPPRFGRGAHTFFTGVGEPLASFMPLAVAAALAVVPPPPATPPEKS